MPILDLLLGRRLANTEGQQTRMTELQGIAAMGRDGLSFAAFGPEAALATAIPLAAAGLTVVVSVTGAILLVLVLLAMSCWQTIGAYLSNGGSYAVAADNRCLHAGFSPAVRWWSMTPRMWRSASRPVSTPHRCRPLAPPYTLPLCLAVLLVITLANLRGTGKAGLVGLPVVHLPRPPVAKCSAARRRPTCGSHQRALANRGRVKSIYLAGPDVFLPNPEAWLDRKKAICAGAGLTGISPLDQLPEEPAGWAALPLWRRIALRNEAHIRRCHAVIANLTPFRGPSADAGTVYEVGFARGLGRPVFGYATVAAPFLDRTLDWLDGQVEQREGSWWDPDGLLIEQFGLFDNLMIEGGIADSGTTILREDRNRWHDLSVFEACVYRAAAAL